jgi:hypothetical protein
MNFAEVVHTRFERVVAVEPNWDGTATLFFRTTSGQVATEHVEFRPWLLASEAFPAEEFRNGVATRRLQNGNPLNRILSFETPSSDFRVTRSLRSQPLRYNGI